MSTATEVKERPILFNGEMVRAVLDGRKTQTRRVVKPQPLTDDAGWYGASGPVGCAAKSGKEGFMDVVWGGPRCPFGKPGDRLWARETWRVYQWHEGEPIWVQFKDGRRHECRSDDYANGLGISESWDERMCIESGQDLEANGFEVGSDDLYHEPDGYTGDTCPTRWRPSIHMPRWASRILLEVTDVRVERVQDISEEDAYAEGVTIRESHRFASNGTLDKRNEARHEFRDLWNSINPPPSHIKRRKSKDKPTDEWDAKHPPTPRYDWDANPWVWVVTFKRLQEWNG